MENHPQNIIGIEVVVVEGAYRGMYGAIVGIEGAEVLIEAKLLGKSSQIMVKETAISYTSPNVYILSLIENEIRLDALYGLQHALDEWWGQEIEKDTVASWEHYLAEKKELWAKFRAISNQVLATFRAAYPNASSATDLVETYLTKGAIQNLKSSLIEKNGQWLPNYTQIRQKLYTNSITEKQFLAQQDRLQKAIALKRKSYVIWWNKQLKKEALTATQYSTYTQQLAYNYQKESFDVYERRATPIKQKLLHEYIALDALEVLLEDCSSETLIEYFGTIEDAPNDCVWKHLQAMGTYEKIYTIFEYLTENERFIKILEGFCLTILTLKTTGKWYLVYVFDNYDDLAIKEPKFEYKLEFIVGAAPIDKPIASKTKDWIVPEDLKQFYRIHNGFGPFNGGTQIFWADNIAPAEQLSDMLFMVDIAKEQAFEPEDYEFENLLEFYGDGSGNGYFFHRKNPTDSNPPVRWWDHETREIGARQSFMDFLNYDLFRYWYDY